MSELKVREAFNRMSLESWQLAYRSKKEKAALARMAEFAEAHGAETMRSDFLHHRSIILELFDRNDEAEAAIKEAYSLTREENFHRYALSLGLLRHAKRRGDRADEVKWIRAAARTAANDPRICAAESGLDLIEVAGGADALSDDERNQCERILTNAWSVCQLKGQPDMSRLVESLEEAKRAYRALNERLRDEAKSRFRDGER